MKLKKNSRFYSELDNNTTLRGKPNCTAMAVLFFVLLIVVFLIFGFMLLYK